MNEISIDYLHKAEVALSIAIAVILLLWLLIAVRRRLRRTRRRPSRNYYDDVPSYAGLYSYREDDRGRYDIDVKDINGIDCYLTDTRTFVAEASETLNISETYVRVRKNRILHKLRELMGSTITEYHEWNGGEVFTHYNLNPSSVDSKLKLKLNSYANPIKPEIEIASLAEGILREFS